MTQNLYSPIVALSLDYISAVIRACIVDSENPADLWSDPLDNINHMGRHPKAWNNDSNVGTLRGTHL
jgi:hypothetical protein